MSVRILTATAAVLLGVTCSNEATGSSAADRCALLGDDEVEKAIGPHQPGVSEPGVNTWGLMSCLWRATEAQVVEGYPQGWFDSIEVAFFSDDIEVLGAEAIVQWAREEASGEPVDGFVEGALWDSTWGTLWFECAGDRFCAVKVTTAEETTSRGDRKSIAIELARAAETRLR